MDFIKSWKAMAILLGALALAAAVLVAVGVMTHGEAGLDPEAPRWAREAFPLAVCASDYVEGTGTAEPAVSGALGAINARLGFDAFAPSRADCAVVVTVGVPSDPSWGDPGGDARLEPGRCAVRTSNTGTVQLLDAVLRHELGHCLGLAHDDFGSSIMAPALRPTDGFPPRLTDHDRDLLRALYGPPG